MDLGVRQIRTSGKGSGSVELTLPATLRDLVGVRCHITLQDGGDPNIVLHPDLQPAREVFIAMWASLTEILLPDDPAALPATAFLFGLQPTALVRDRPFLCWRDGLALAENAPHDVSAVSRSIAALTQAIAGLRDLRTIWAADFGAICAKLASGVWPTYDRQDSRDVALATVQARHELDPSGSEEACRAGVGSEVFWCHARPRLEAAAELFALRPALHAPA
jgi:hypothetical protein